MGSKAFPDTVVQRALLWCGRHCCVCGKQCGVDIETHHVDPSGEPDQDNCLPVCYDCHAKLSHYDPKQPRGRKFRPEELKARRDQVYEMHTRSLVPPTDFRITQDVRGLPCVRFLGANLGDYPPVRALIKVRCYIDGKDHGVIDHPHYSGTTAVNLNPRHGFNGWFELPEEATHYTHRLLLKVEVTIIDPYERPHSLLPFGFVHMPDAPKDQPGWYYEPAPECPEVIGGP